MALNRQELDFLMQKHNISLDGPISPEKWPAVYHPLFRLVRDVDRLRYDDYKRSGLDSVVSSQSVIHEMCARVETLVRTGYDLYQTGAAEARWALSTQDLVLRGFHQETRCSHCRKCDWISELMATVRDTNELEGCRCKGKKEVTLSRFGESEFKNHLGSTICDTTVPEVQTKVLSHQTTDLVIGFRQSRQFSELLSANPPVQDFILENYHDMLFPFLLLETKGDGNRIGFDYIERQSAFASTALLAIQKTLRFMVDFKMDPFLWFLANRGEEWRVYACVPDDLNTRIIELWRGSIRRHDHALQLLLITDMICEWARTVLKKELIDSLLSTRGMEYENLDFMNTDSSSETDDRTTDIAGAFTGMSISKTTVASTKPFSFGIRPKPDIQCRFRSISLPESPSRLTQALLAIGGTRHFYHTVRQLLVAVFELEDPLIIRADFIYRLHRAWTNSADKTSCGDPEINFASLSFKAYFDYQGIPVQELICITASPTTVNLLLSFLPETERILFLWDAPIPSRIAPQTIRRLRYLAASELSRFRRESLCLHLQVSNQIASGSSWVTDGNKDQFIENFWNVVDGQPEVFWRCPRQISSTVKNTELVDAEEVEYIL